MLTKQNVNYMEKIRKTLKVHVCYRRPPIDKYGKLYRSGSFLNIILPLHVVYMNYSLKKWGRENELDLNYRPLN